MTAFDAESYLRSMGEQAMVDVELGDADAVVSELDHAAAALVLGGVIDERTATEISSDYAQAIELVRRPGLAARLHQVRRRPSEELPPDLEARRVFMPDVVLSLPGVGELRVRSVVVSQGRTAIEGVLRTTTWPAPPGGLGSSLRISSGGQAGITQFSGGTRGGELSGLWECDRTFPAGTERLDVNGCRLELGPGRRVPSFAVQTFSADERVQRFLWLLVSGWGSDFGENATEAAVAALRAAGLLGADALGDGPLRWSKTRRYGASGPDAVSVTGPLPNIEIPAPVSADAAVTVITRSPPGVAPAGTVGIGAVSPWFDGVMVAIDSLSFDESGMTAEVEVSGATSPRPFPGQGRLDVKPISWWVADEHGHRYIGNLTTSSSNGLHTRGKIRFGQVKGEPDRLSISVATPNAGAAIAIVLEWR